MTFLMTSESKKNRILEIFAELADFQIFAENPRNVRFWLGVCYYDNYNIHKQFKGA